MGLLWPMEGLGCEQLMATSEGSDAPKFTSEGINRRLPTQPKLKHSLQRGADHRHTRDESRKH